MPWLQILHPGSDSRNKPAAVVLAKRTYTIANGKVGPAPSQVPIATEDLLAAPDTPHTSEVLTETDIVPCKPSTDVVIIGRACAPRGRQALRLECEARVGPLCKMVRVYGERKVEKKAFMGLSLGEPAPFTEIPFSYTRAYGGYAALKNRPVMPFFPNPLGKGFSVKGNFDDSGLLSVPNLEDPGSPVTGETLVLDKFEEWPNAPKPASFGWTCRNFYPRYTFAGVLPEFLEMVTGPESKRWAPPPRMDPRFFQGASEGLWGRQLAGGEGVVLKYFDPDNPVFQFSLPVEKPLMSASIGDGFRELAPVLQTVVIDMNEKTLTMLWRGLVEMEDIEEICGITVTVEPLE